MKFQNLLLITTGTIVNQDNTVTDWTSYLQILNMGNYFILYYPMCLTCPATLLDAACISLSVGALGDCDGDILSFRVSQPGEKGLCPVEALVF